MAAPTALILHVYSFPIRFGFPYPCRIIARRGLRESVTEQGSTFSFSYNGLGDRYQQARDVATTCSLDLALDLIRALGDGTNAYLYDLGRIGEEGASGWGYPLGDALGSVRQLTDSSASLALSRSFEPFGALISSKGGGSSAQAR
jgi:hypothetical protein